MSSLNDADLLAIATKPRGEAMLAIHELGNRIARRKDPEPLKRACLERLGTLPGDAVFLVGPAGSHVRLTGGAP